MEFYWNSPGDRRRGARLEFRRAGRGPVGAVAIYRPEARDYRCPAAPVFANVLEGGSSASSLSGGAEIPLAKTIVVDDSQWRVARRRRPLTERSR